MKDYTFYIAAAYLFTAIALGWVVLQSLLNWRRAQKDGAGHGDA